jgi:flagellar hook-associated protein 1
MSGLFGTLGVARSALFAQQVLLQTASNNVANAGQTDYSRQRVDLAPSLSQTLTMGQVGSGVTVEGIRRIRDSFLDHQFWQAQQSLGESQAGQATLSQIESLFGEPSDSGLQANLTSFFSSVQDLASHPEDATTRSTVLEQASVLADGFQRLSNGLSDLKRNLTSEITDKVSQVNQLVKDIASLDGQIQTQPAAGGPTNALMDQRDKAVDELAQMIGIVRTDRTDGSMQITLAGSGGLLVSGTDTWALSAAPAAGDTYALSLNGVSVVPQGGGLTGLLAARNDSTDYVKYAQGRLNELATSLIGQVNGIQASGAGLAALQSTTAQYAVPDRTLALESASAGLPFAVSDGQFQVFTYNAAGTPSGPVTISIDGTTTLNSLMTDLHNNAGLTVSVDASNKLTVTAPAGTTFRFAKDTSNVLAALGVNALFTGKDATDIGVNQNLVDDPRLLSTGVVDANGVVGPSDTTAAVALGALQTRKSLEGGLASFEEFYAETVGVLGARTAAAQSSYDTQSAVTQTIDNQRQQVSGVSLDDEMIDLTKAQRAYQAAARVVSIVDTLLDTVVNGMLS